MRISLIISFFFHIIIVLAFQTAFPLHWPGEELRAYRVELIRPPTEGMDDEIPETGGVRANKESQPSQANDQDTISLDTKDERYITYARIIKNRIMQHWIYPPEARGNLVEGKLIVIFSLSKNGNMTRVEINQTSGHEILDKEALRAIRDAAPFPTFPEHITVSQLNINANFDYRLTSKK